MPPQQIGPYRIIRSLGEGGMGAVYEAIQQPIERRVALKVLLPQYAQDTDALVRFFHEAKAVNLIEHPSIVQVSDYGQAADGTAYLVMELLRGESLSARLERLHGDGQRLRVVEVVQFAAQIADALAAAHAKAVVHRDLKPSNVMLVHDSAVFGGERAKLVDFGIAKLAQEPGKGTASSVVMGTPQYMSPEQCAGAGAVDSKTDVYALGVMLYEMVAGRRPFLGESPIQLIGQHALAQPPPLSECDPKVPAELATLVHGLLVKDKALRPTMRQVEAELSDLLLRLSETSPTARSATSASEETPQYQSAKALPSTVSRFLGQALRPVRPRRARPALFVVAGGAVLMLGFALLSRQGLQRKVAAPVVSQPAITLPIATKSHAEERASRLPVPSSPPVEPIRPPSTPSEGQPLAKKEPLAVVSSGSADVDLMHGYAELAEQKKESELSAPKLNTLAASKPNPSAASKPNPLAASRPKLPAAKKPAQPAAPRSATRRVKTSKDYDD